LSKIDLDMRLILLRHAKSEKAEPGMSDRDRRLNARGRGDASTMGAYMARHQLKPDFTLISPAQRTRETWEHIAERISSPSAPIFDRRLYNAGADAILRVIEQSDDTVQALLVIGHNPGLHDLARKLIASGDVEARERLNEGLPTTGLAVIDFAAESWRKLHPHGGRLERFVTPRSLASADPA
jgi:phosphohistidine phosphatase